MNKNILNTGVQEFINKNLDADIVSVLLKKQIFDTVTQKELAQQLESKKKCIKKLPTWFSALNIYYPKKLNIEQTSSEIAARYKVEIIDGKSLIDLTGGFGVDSYFFSQKTASVFHCEIDENLSKIAHHNFEILEAKNIKTIAQNGLSFLEKTSQIFDWIYIDPSRRNQTKGKVFLLSDCLPNIPSHLNLLFQKSNNLLIKTSPLLDISTGIKELEFVKEIHVLSINNEVKELLWVLKKGFLGETTIKTINHTKKDAEAFNFSISQEKQTISTFSQPLNYLYEPNSAIMKSGGFKTVGKTFSIKKIQEHTHLYTSEEAVDFPGRLFKIKQTGPYARKFIKQLGVKKANITIRNFPDNVATIRKKFNIKDGGDVFLFFVKNHKKELIIIVCSKIPNI